LRNAWRFSFDELGRLWAADVGQNAWEEISIIEKGGNYGWRIMEGSHCYNPSSNCDQSGLMLPIWEYDHSQLGGYSITGGFVYEGLSVPEIVDKYVYGDFVTGNIWAYNPIDKSNTFLFKYNGQISTFGVDENKELYFADYNSGEIYKFLDDNINSMDEINYFSRTISIDANGNTFVTGSTNSVNYPTTIGAYQATFGGSDDAFITKLNPFRKCFHKTIPPSLITIYGFTDIEVSH